MRIRSLLHIQQCDLDHAEASVARCRHRGHRGGNAWRQKRRLSAQRSIHVRCGSDGHQRRALVRTHHRGNHNHRHRHSVHGGDRCVRRGRRCHESLRGVELLHSEQRDIDHGHPAGAGRGHRRCRGANSRWEECRQPSERSVHVRGRTDGDGRVAFIRAELGWQPNHRDRNVVHGCNRRVCRSRRRDSHLRLFELLHSREPDYDHGRPSSAGTGVTGRCEGGNSWR